MAHRLSRLLAVLGAFLTAAVGSADEGRTGTVAGSVTLEPMQQPPMAALYRSRTRAPVLEPDPPRAVVYLETEDGEYPASAAADAQDIVTVGQRGYQFRPAVVAVPRGAQVAFPNHDDEFHNVFSYSSIKRFDLGRYRKDEESPLISFDEPGVARVYCEIHKHMRSLIVVLDTPWHTTTDPDGAFRLTGVPAGNYTLRAFLPSERTLASPIEVVAGETVHVEFRAP